ncbi:MAG TPA: hypothetical protein VGN72_03650 [Tepidisphaeraceae bacterium]|jgi:hypothetical protein|nr:hypothetical protein [Tepidisphaeraceae bacterium]
MIDDIHLIPHTHADFGYTDLPSTAWRFLPRYVRDALSLAEATDSFPEEARLNWTIEITFQLEAFLAQASEREKTQLGKLVDEGRFEIGAMPFHTTALLTQPEWQAMLDRSAALFEMYRPRTCFQNDINGLPWGLIPSLSDRGVRYVMMGINTYNGGTPRPAPYPFWWQGPDGRKLLAWTGLHYAAGFAFFHEAEWRRGPVPAYHDVWYNTPGIGETWDASPAALRAAREVLSRKIESSLGHYPHRTLGLQVTNMWRMDNDPPAIGLCEFVRAWNDAGHGPRLRLSTPAKFLSTLEREAGDRIDVVRGDWGEWWADGVTSMPTEVALAQRAKTALAELPAALKAVQAQDEHHAGFRQGWFDAAMFTEHTFASYESLPQPYSPLSIGNYVQKADYACRADEAARVIWAEGVRRSPRFRSFSQTRRLAVLNPGGTLRSGWVQIPFPPLREPANALRDVSTGKIYPFEALIGPTWSAADEQGPQQFEVPNDIWTLTTTGLRFYCDSVPPGQERVFELVQQADMPTPVTAEVKGRSARVSWEWEAAAGKLRSLKDEAGNELIDPDAPYGLGQVVLELPQGYGAREPLLSHDWTRIAHLMKYESPRLLSWRPEPSHYGARFVSEWEHPNLYRARQNWEFRDAVGGVDLTTTFWFREHHAPQAVLIAFPFLLPDAEMTYASLGYPTRVGHDQMPDSCGEYQMVHDGVKATTDRRCIVLATPDTPLGCFQSISLRTGRKAFVPSNAHFYSVVTENYWKDNFSHTRAAKMSVQHLIASGIERGEAIGRLLAYPCR